MVGGCSDVNEGAEHRVREDKFMIDEEIGGVFERALQRLNGERDAAEAQAVIDRYLPCHNKRPSERSVRYQIDRHSHAKFHRKAATARAFVHPR